MGRLVSGGYRSNISMNWQINPFSIVLIVFSGLLLAVGWIAWQRRRAPGSLPLALFLFAVGQWSLFFAFELAVAGIPEKITISKIEYLGICSSPVLLLWFAVEFFRQEKLTFRLWHLLLWVIPLVSLVLAATNEWHHLIWTRFTPVPGSDLSLVLYDHGVGFWVAVGFDYLMVTVASIFILRAAFRLRYLYRSQALALVFGIPLPWIGNILYVFNLGSPGLDFTEFGFGITGIILAWALYRLQLFNIVPVARDRVIEWMHECLVVVDKQQRIVDANPALFRLLAEISPDGVASAAVIGSQVERAFLHFPQLAGLFKAGKEGQFEIRTGDGEGRADFDVRISALHNRAQDAIGWMAILHDITDLNRARETAFNARDQAVEAAAENSRLYEQMKQLASTDTLTGLNTRRHFFDLATVAFEKTLRQGLPIAAIMVDLDNFKQVNDEFGHMFGDHVLQVVADSSKASIRQIDILGRFGGEEFVVLLPETSAQLAARVAERLCRRIANLEMEFEGRRLQITASAGVAEITGTSETLDMLIDRADQALLSAKRAGRNQVQCYNC
jgi:diguanylate cyclase (GGDEF)-like protein